MCHVPPAAPPRTLAHCRRRRAAPEHGHEAAAQALGRTHRRKAGAAVQVRAASRHVRGVGAHLATACAPRCPSEASRSPSQLCCVTHRFQQETGREAPIQEPVPRDVAQVVGKAGASPVKLDDEAVRDVSSGVPLDTIRKCVRAPGCGPRSRGCVSCCSHDGGSLTGTPSPSRCRPCPSHSHPPTPAAPPGT